MADLWREVALRTRAWLLARALPVRDAIVLLPFAALLTPARAAWAELGGWQPRIETPLTLAASLGPPAAMAPGACSGEPTQDALAASQILLRLSWGAQWAVRDPAGFVHVVRAVVDAAQALRARALALEPAARESFWNEARALLPVASGPTTAESSLLRMALEWVASDCSAATDRLFAQRPAAWIVLRMGGAVPIAEALLGRAGLPSLRLTADPSTDEPFAAIASTAVVECLVCEDFEAEAQAAASEVLQALNAGRTPVALVALDRAVVRRVRALLARSKVPLIDETGWLLATTRAAAAVSALLRAARPGASSDTRLEWLKTWPAASASALDALEARWRGRRMLPSRHAAAEVLWEQAQDYLRPLTVAPEQSLAAWLELLHERQAASGMQARLADDQAGAQVLAALGCNGGARWQGLAQTLHLSLAGFTHWVESTLEALPFLPTPDAGAQVVLTPLARAFGRPFQHLVIPGADHVRLGSIEPGSSLLSDSLSGVLGLDTIAVKHQRRRLALAQGLRAPRVTLLRRRRDDKEPLGESPDVEWLLLTRARQRAPAWLRRDWRPATRQVAAHPLKMPTPVASGALPTGLSASRLEALRACPYRFFSRAVLNLDEVEELDAALAKRDYGTWLHAVLHRFHSQRDAVSDDVASDAAALQVAADGVTDTLDMSASELLPFRASFETFAPSYLRWLHEREGAGWRWQSGETEQERALPGVSGLLLRGRLDRLDEGPAAATQLIDYKTTRTETLKRRVAEPLEDTQLAFYAALLGAPRTLGAAYLSLDDAQAPAEVVHRNVHRSAQVLLDGVSDEWRRLQQGAPLPALGEGAVCETCEARGLCRRDHWIADR